MAINSKIKAIIDEILSWRAYHVSTHSDADGVTAAFFMSLVSDVDEIYFPLRFGGYTFTTKLMLDMQPYNPEYKGVIIDHHPPLPHTKKMKRILGKVPACLMVYELFDIPEEHRWKVVCGLVGDVQSEIVPIEVIEKHPIITKQRMWISKSWSGEVKKFESPVWLLMSGGINAACKTGNSSKAYEILKHARKPIDLIRSQALKEEKEKVKNETVKILKSTFPIDLGSVQVWEFDSEFEYIHREIAGLLQRETNKTVIVFNHKNGMLSLRGFLTNYLIAKMNKKYELGGHAGYAGGTIPEKSNFDEFVKDIMKVLP